jgi:hypothetical protein
MKSRSPRRNQPGIDRAAAIFLLVGTLSSFFPKLSSAAASVPSYLNGWLQITGVPPSGWWLHWYFTAVMIFGLLAGVRMARRASCAQVVQCMGGCCVFADPVISG